MEELRPTVLLASELSTAGERLLEAIPMTVPAASECGTGATWLDAH